MQWALERLPGSFNGFEVKERLDVILRLMPMIVPKVKALSLHGERAVQALAGFPKGLGSRIRTESRLSLIAWTVNKCSLLKGCF